MNALMTIDRNRDYPKKNLTYLGNAKIAIKTPIYPNHDVFHGTVWKVRCVLIMRYGRDANIHA